MKKRISVPNAKQGEIKIVWGREFRGQNPSLVYCNGGSETLGKCSGRDTKLLMLAFERPLPIFDNRSLVNELELRGYDLETLKFSIQLKD